MKLFDLDRWEEIWATITRNKTRSFFTAMGIFWGVFMLVVMSGAGLFFKRTFTEQVGAFSTNSAFFYTNSTSIPYKGLPIGRWWQFYDEDKAVIKKQLPGITNIAGIIFGGNTTISYNDKQGDFNVIGHEPHYNLIEPQILMYGRYINDIDMSQKRKVCTIGVQIAEELFGKDVDPTGKAVRFYNTYFTVVGVHTPAANGVNIGGSSRRSVILPFKTLQQIQNKGNKFDMMAVVAKNNINMFDYEKKVQAIMLNLHNISPDDTKAIGGFNVKEQFDVFQNLFLGIDMLTWIVGLGTLFAGVVGISNIMLVVVRERTQEIGVRRALGAKPRVIISQIMSESFILTIIAGIAGLTFGVGVLSIADKIIASTAQHGQVPPSAQISLGIGVVATLIIITGGLLAGVIPANRAMNIKPVDAIREE